MEFTTWIFAGFAFLLVLGLIFKTWGAFLPETFRIENTIETVTFLSEVTPLFFTAQGWMRWFPVNALPGENLKSISFSPDNSRLEFVTQNRTVFYDIVSLEPGKYLSVILSAGDPLRSKGMETGFTFTIFTSDKKTRIRIEEFWTVKDTGYRLGFHFSLKKEIIRRHETLISNIRSVYGNR